MLNLVRNAIEAITGAVYRKEPPRGRSSAASPPRVEIGVRDNGPGVDDQLARHLFDRLATSKEEGLGLGLPICVSIIESHGGRIWLHSRDAGSTEFRFSLPLDQPDRS